MTKYEFINQNIVVIKEEIYRGMLPVCIVNHLIIYCRYDHYRKRGYSAGESTFFTAEDNNISEMSVYRIRKSMEAEI